ncbi:helix-turn-helix domain-containing protein [Streptomyces sp. NPDC005151]
MRDTRNGRATKAKEENDLPGVWAAYGKLLQHLRKRSELSQQALGDAIGYSLEQVASVEQGRRPAKDAFTVAADRVLAAGGVLEVLQDEVDRAKLPKFFRNFALIEAEVASRFSYDPLLVPGLLQTEAYARAVFAGHCPPLSEEIVDQHTEARLARQKLLARMPLADLSFIVSEEALRNPVSDAEVMRGQWQRLLDVGRLRNVEVQVMPAAPGFHAGLNGPFVVLQTKELQHLGYIESQEVGCVVRDPTEVSAFGLRYGKLRARALNGVESARLIERLVGET